MSEEKKKPTFRNTQDFIEKFVKDNKITICNKTREVLFNGKIANKPSTIILKAFDAHWDKRNVKDKFLKLFFEDHLEEMKKELMQKKAKELLTFKEGGPSELKKLANLLYNEEKYFDLHMEFIIVMKYWLQSLYYKLNGETFMFPIIPIFYSRSQGKGKSILVQKILEPFAPFTRDTSIDQICDPRCYPVLSDNWACSLDECRGATIDQINQLKYVITAPRTFPRNLSTHNMPSIPVNTIFVGNGNEAISRILNDPSGMRRFHDFPILEELTEEQVNTIDMKLIIQGHRIWTKEEAKEIRKFYDQYIQPKQDLMKKEDHVVEFVQMSELSWVRPSVGQKLSSVNDYVPSKEIFHNFCDYWAKQGLKRTPLRFKEFMIDLCDIIGQNEVRHADCWRGLWLSKNYKRNVLMDVQSQLKSLSSFYS